MTTEAAVDEATPLSNARTCWARISKSSPVYSFFFNEIEITHATHGNITARLPVSATIVDWAGGIAIASTGLLNTGVSTDIHVSYVSGAKAGDVLTIVGDVARVGRVMAFTTVTIYKGGHGNGGGNGGGEDGGGGDGQKLVVVAHGTHTKYVARDQPVAVASSA